MDSRRFRAPRTCLRRDRVRTRPAHPVRAELVAPLRIALVASARYPIREPFAGGLEAHTAQLASGLRALGHHVSVFGGTGSDPEFAAGVNSGIVDRIPNPIMTIATRNGINPVPGFEIDPSPSSTPCSMKYRPSSSQKAINASDSTRTVIEEPSVTAVPSSIDRPGHTGLPGAAGRSSRKSKSVRNPLVPVGMWTAARSASG